jgi:hypothetical protein
MKLQEARLFKGSAVPSDLFSHHAKAIPKQYNTKKNSTKRKTCSYSSSNDLQCWRQVGKSVHIAGSQRSRGGPGPQHVIRQLLVVLTLAASCDFVYCPACFVSFLFRLPVRPCWGARRNLFHRAPNPLSAAILMWNSGKSYHSSV